MANHIVNFFRKKEIYKIINFINNYDFLCQRNNNTNDFYQLKVYSKKLCDIRYTNKKSEYIMLLNKIVMSVCKENMQLHNPKISPAKLAYGICDILPNNCVDEYEKIVVDSLKFNPEMEEHYRHLKTSYARIIDEVGNQKIEENYNYAIIFAKDFCKDSNKIAAGIVDSCSAKFNLEYLKKVPSADYNIHSLVIKTFDKRGTYIVQLNNMQNKDKPTNNKSSYDKSNEGRDKF